MIINVQELSTQEKAQILYNHLKLGDQPKKFLSELKPHLPEIAERHDFLPETARRLGSTFFAARLPTSRASIMDFFESPEEFLLETIANLSADCRAAIAVVFMNGGRIPSPVAASGLVSAGEAFGVHGGAVRNQLEALNGSLLLLAKDEGGPYWTYKHPTVSDAFASYVAGSPELVEIYLRGARPESIIHEVVCRNTIHGAPVIVPKTLYALLADRIRALEGHQLSSFLSYRSNRDFAELMLQKRPDILKRLHAFAIPIKDDTDASLAATLYHQGLLPDNIRQDIVSEIRSAALGWADASFLDDPFLGDILTEEEKDDILSDVETKVLGRIKEHVERLRNEWDKDYPPDDYFDYFQHSIKLFTDALAWKHDYSGAMKGVSKDISYAIARMNEVYEPSSPTSAPTQSSAPQSTPLVNLFRDVDA